MYPRTKQKLLRGLGLGLLILVGIGAGYIAFQPYERFRAHEATREAYRIDRPADDVLTALRAAANRIGGWSFVGTAGDGDRLQVVFTREVRVPPGVDDVTVTLLDGGDHTELSARSRSRKTWADFGRNRRNLHRLDTELRAVLEGSHAP